MLCSKATVDSLTFGFTPTSILMSLVYIGTGQTDWYHKKVKWVILLYLKFKECAPIPPLSERQDVNI